MAQTELKRLRKPRASQWMCHFFELSADQRKAVGKGKMDGYAVL